MYQIEKGVPVPAHAKSKGMEIGDSVVFPGNGPTFGANARRLAPRKFVVRTIDAESVRVWRTE